MKKPEDRLTGMIPDNMLRRGLTVRNELLSKIRILFEQRSVPLDGWDESSIQELITMLSSMDTDKDPVSARIGEREARIACNLNNVYSGGFNHGIGRSGDLTAPQPKAPGASIMYRLANSLAYFSLRKLGLPNIKGAFVAPLSTGMSIFLALSYVRKIHGGRDVIYPRVDHKSPIKAVELSGGSLKMVEGELDGDAVIVPPEKIHESFTDDTLAVLSTTTFFPPREPDFIKEIAKLCRDENIPHIINNAYGVQSPEIMELIRRSIDAGRVDAIVQSTDKNFLTPVGGSIVASPSSDTLKGITKMYAGRADANPVLQFLVSILKLGLNGYIRLRDEQRRAKADLEKRVSEVAEKFGERVLSVFNPVACAITIENVDVKSVGGALYNLRVTGPRAIRKGEFGSCMNDYPHSYLTMNAAIGVNEKDINLAVERLERAYRDSMNRG